MVWLGNSGIGDADAVVVVAEAVVVVVEVVVVVVEVVVVVVEAVVVVAEAAVAAEANSYSLSWRCNKHLVPLAVWYVDSI